MNFKVMSKAAFPKWIEHLTKTQRLIGPKPAQGQYAFAEVESAEELDLAYTTTMLPPKKVLLPQREALLGYKTDGSKAAPKLDETPTVILGVHTCDLHAIALLDRVFGGGFADQHYQTRRDNTTLVSIECLAPCSEYAFCKSMGTLSTPDEFDLHLTDLGDDYAIDVGSEKGTALLQGFVLPGTEAIRDATDEDYRRVNQVMSGKWPNFPYRLDFDVSELPSLLALSYRSVLWEELGARCLACGMCTAVCPTCCCFNVIDEVDLTLTAGERYRTWDSCQLDRFATVAGGHDFRPDRAARLRHRFLHKGKYQTEAYGLIGCVGCGRCAQACLVNIDPVETLNTLYRRRATTASKQKVIRKVA